MWKLLEFLCCPMGVTARRTLLGAVLTSPREQVSLMEEGHRGTKSPQAMLVPTACQKLLVFTTLTEHDGDREGGLSSVASGSVW